MDNCISRKTPIYPLNMHGEGTTSKSRKRKIQLGKSMDDELNVCRPFSAGLFEEISSHMRIVKELVSKLPQGPSESSTNPYSYVIQSDYDKLLEDKKAQWSTISRLEWAYNSLALSHWDV